MANRLPQEWMAKAAAEQRHLRVAVAEVRQYVARPRPEVRRPGAHRWAAGLAERLLELHDEMFKHFGFESEARLWEEQEEPRSETSDRWLGISNQHAALLDEVRRLMSDALAYSGGLGLEGVKLRQRVENLLDDLQAHAREEDQLLQKLENRDDPKSKAGNRSRV